MAYTGKRRKDVPLSEDDGWENTVKAACLWERNEETEVDCITSVNYKGLNIDNWMRVHHKEEAAAASSVSVGDSFQHCATATASAMALQDIPKQQLQRQQTQLLQKQQAHQQQFQQQQAHQQRLQQQHLQQRQAQQPLHQQQQQPQELCQQRQVQQQLQQQLFQQLQRQQLQLQRSSQLQLPDGVPNCLAPILERVSSFSSPTAIVIPAISVTPPQVCADSDPQCSFSADESCSHPVKSSCISRPHSSSSLISDAGNDQPSSQVLSNKLSDSQHPSSPCQLAAARTGIFPSDLHLPASLLPSSSADSTTLDAHLTGRLEPPLAVPSSCFISSFLDEQTDQLNIPLLPFQNSPAMHRSEMKDQEQVQSELVLANLIFPEAPAMASRLLSQLIPQNQVACGKQPLDDSSSTPATDPFASLNARLNGNLTDAVGVQQQIVPAAPPAGRAIARTYTKVYKLGSIGRALDVNRFRSYAELRCELARMFGLEGQLDRKSDWQLVFIDNENDILLVGDDPWEVFVASVRGIRILSPSEVAYYMNNDESVPA